MSTRSKIDLQAAIKESINELFSNDDFIDRLTKQLSDKVEQKLIVLEEQISVQNTRINDLEKKLDNLQQDRSTPIPRPPEDEDSFPVLHERELHSLHRNVPALRRRDVDTATIKQHYYPEGGWGWLVCGAAFLAHLLTSGIQLAFGLLYLYTMTSLLQKNQDKEIYAMGTDMNQLNGKYVNVVLSVEAGRGMDFLKNNLHITGNFCNRILESDKIPAMDRPLFNTELVWEVEKKDLRRIRSSNQPLRVECITTDPQGRKERVGFTLLSLRSAQIIPLKNAKQDVSTKWHKLIGCQLADKKQCHPELYLSLAVRDHLLNEVEPSSSIEQMPYISEEEQTTAEETLLPSQFPVVYLDDGYVQIGDEENMGAFSLNLLIEEVVNLDTLLPEILVFRHNKEKYYISFRILGVTIKTKPFRKELHNSIVLNEKIVVKLLSNKSILEEFFSTQDINVSFCCGQDKLGTTTIELKDISENIKDSRYYFKFPSVNGLVPYDCTEKSPWISLQSWLEQNYVEELEIQKEEDKPKTKMVISNIPRMPSCGGDELLGACVLDKLEKIDVKAQSDTDTPTKDVIVPPAITKSVDTVIKNIPLSPKNIDVFSEYKKYILEIHLKSLIWKKSPKDTKIIFKFLHPKAASYITIFTEISDEIGELIQLNNLKVKVVYIATEDKAVNLLNAWPPKLVLTDEKERSLNEECELSAVLSSTFSVENDVTLKAARTLEPLAKLNVVLNWNEFGLEEPDDPNLTLFPAILDEVISAKEISDISKWKVKEKDRFDSELEKIKEKELAKLQHEWELKRSEIEEQLLKSVNKCKKLQENLQNKVNSLKVEKSLIHKRNKNNLYEEIFRENWKKFGNENTKEVVELLSRTERDNKHLKEIIIELRDKLKTIEKSTLTKNQTANLLKELRVLEEKFEDAQNAKVYFKEQWKRACDEIHFMKREDIMNLQNQIQQNKEELSQLSLDQLNDNMENYSPSSIMSARSSSLFF